MPITSSGTGCPVRSSTGRSSSESYPPHGAAVFAVVPATTGNLLGDAATLTGGSDRASTATLRDGALEAAVDGEAVTFALERDGPTSTQE